MYLDKLKSGVLEAIHIAGFELTSWKPLQSRWNAQKKVLESVTAPVIALVGTSTEEQERYSSLFARAALHCLESDPDRYAECEALARRLHNLHLHRVAALETGGVRLDDALAQISLAHVDLLRIECRGAELRCLQGAAGLLRKRALQAIFVRAAFHAADPASPLYQDLAIFLASYGYSLFGLYDLELASSGQLLEAGALFVAGTQAG